MRQKYPAAAIGVSMVTSFGEAAAKIVAAAPEHPVSVRQGSDSISLSNSSRKRAVKAVIEADLPGLAWRDGNCAFLDLDELCVGAGANADRNTALPGTKGPAQSGHQAPT